jgi:hypothetical protein
MKSKLSKFGMGAKIKNNAIKARQRHTHGRGDPNSGLKAYPALDYQIPPCFAIAVHKHNMCITLAEQ